MEDEKARDKALSELERAVGENSTQKDKTLLTLSAAAIGFGVPLQEHFQGNSHVYFIFSMAAFLLSIFFVLFSFFATEKGLLTQIIRTASKGTEIKNEILWNRIIMWLNSLAALFFFMGASVLFLCFLNQGGNMGDKKMIAPQCTEDDKSLGRPIFERHTVSTSANEAPIKQRFHDGRPIYTSKAVVPPSEKPPAIPIEKESQPTSKNKGS